MLSWVDGPFFVVLPRLTHTYAVWWDWLGLPGSNGLVHMFGGMSWLSARPFPPHGSHHPGSFLELLYIKMKYLKRAWPSLEVTQNPFCRTQLEQATGQPRFKGWERKAKPHCHGVWHREVSWGPWILQSTPEWKKIINACVHILSLSPLNSNAFKELNILFSFVPPIATLIVLSTQWVFNSILTNAHIYKHRNWSLLRENAYRYS